MKTLAILLAVVEFVYIFTAKLAIFMVSLFAIIFACLFAQNMLESNAVQKRPARQGARP